jgi:hypothetical protein
VDGLAGVVVADCGDMGLAAGLGPGSEQEMKAHAKTARRQVKMNLIENIRRPPYRAFSPLELCYSNSRQKKRGDPGVAPWMIIPVNSKYKNYLG